VAESEGLKNKQATGTANAKKVQMSDWPKDQRRRKQKDEGASSRQPNKPIQASSKSIAQESWEEHNLAAAPATLQCERLIEN